MKPNASRKPIRISTKFDTKFEESNHSMFCEGGRAVRTERAEVNEEWAPIGLRFFPIFPEEII